MNQGKISTHVEQCLKDAGRMWTYQGPPRKEAYHALLASGQHADGYVDVGGYIKENAARRYEFATYLVDLLPRHVLFSIKYVGGAATSSTLLAADVAKISEAKHICMVKQDKLQVWDPDNPKLKDGATIWEVEELLTTASSALAFRQGIRLAYPDIQVNFSPFLLTIVDRSDPSSPLETVENSKILSLLRLPIRNFDPANCPYCQAESKAIKPKEGNNWHLLTVV